MLIALVLGELVALTGVMGIVAELLQEGIRLASPAGGLVIPTFWIVLTVAGGIFLLLWFGHYRLFEKVLTTFVILMVFCFVAVFFMVSPSYSAVVAGMIPSIPDTPDASRLVAAMAGTTCSAAVFIVRSTVVAEKGWTADDLGREKRDALVSASVMVFLSAMVMAVAAGTLFVRGMTMESTLEMIGLLEPIGGDLAAFLLIVGISGAGLSTVFPLVLIAPWLIADYAGWKRDLRSRSSRLLIALGLLFSFGSVFLDQTPPVLMVIAMALQAAILPAVAIPAFYLLNRKEVMGKEHLATPGWNAGADRRDPVLAGHDLVRRHGTPGMTASPGRAVTAHDPPARTMAARPLRSFRRDELRVEVYGTPEGMGEAAAARVERHLAAAIASRGDASVVLASAVSQSSFLGALRSRPIDWTRVTVFHLDEYTQLPQDHPASFRRFLREHILDAVRPGRVHLLQGDADDPEGEIERYESLLRAHPLDVACIGIGENGHIAFNDPPVADFDDPALVKEVELDDACRLQQVHDGWFSAFEETPRRALTLTVPAIMASRAISCVVPGERKADAVHDALNGPIATACPASILRRHEDATLLLDPASAARV